MTAGRRWTQPWTQTLQHGTELSSIKRHDRAGEGAANLHWTARRITRRDDGRHIFRWPVAGQFFRLGQGAFRAGGVERGQCWVHPMRCHCETPAAQWFLSSQAPVCVFARNRRRCRGSSGCTPCRPRQMQRRRTCEAAWTERGEREALRSLGGIGDAIGEPLRRSEFRPRCPGSLRGASRHTDPDHLKMQIPFRL
jgi:hypothetical protein